MIGRIGIVHVIAMRTTAHWVPTTLVGIPVWIPPEIQPFHFQEDLQKQQQRFDEETSAPPTLKRERESERLGWVNPRQEIRIPSRRFGGPRCEREICVMMVVCGVDIVGVIAMRTTALREPTTVVRLPVRIPLRIPPEIQLFHFQEDLQKEQQRSHEEASRPHI